MPSEPPDPMITDDFLNDVRACTWSGDHLLMVTGGTVYPWVQHRATPDRWELHGTGSLIAQSTYNLLCNGTANTNGSFTSGGTTYTLHNDNGRAVAVPV